MSSTRDVPSAAPQDFSTAYRQVLEQAVEVLTRAARLPRPSLRRTDQGSWVASTEVEQMDWAEFVALAIAGAAANFGGVEEILSGRSGSWEAEGVRQLLYSTAGTDETFLWQHRTDPIEITLMVEEILVERTNAWREYDEASQELDRRYEAAEANEPVIEYSRYVWEYDRSADGSWVPCDPMAPPWSVEAWRAAYDTEAGDSDEVEKDLEALLTGELLGAGAQQLLRIGLPKSPEAAAELARLESDRDARLAVFADLDEKLEEQRRREWAAYGEALKARVEALAAATPGLAVPVRVAIDIDSFPSSDADRLETSLESRLVDAAVLAVPTPEDLPGTPWERLEGTSGG